MAWERHSTFELLAWMKFAVRGTIVLIGFVFLLGLLIITSEFVYRLVEWLDAKIFSTPWG